MGHLTLAVPGEPQPMPSTKPTTGSHQEHPWVTLLTAAQGWGTRGWRRRAAWDPVRFIMGCLGRNKKHKKEVEVIWGGLEVEQWKGADRAGGG